jgi:hypothetical protein
MKIKYSLADIKKTTHPTVPWLAALIYDPLSIRVVWVIANFTNIIPNQITCVSFLIGLASAWCFLQGAYYYLIPGALLIVVSFILDWSDGKLARIKKLESKFGKYLDAILDQTRTFLTVLGLAYGQYSLTGDSSLFFFGMLYIFLYLLHWISDYEFYIIQNKFPKKETDPNITSTSAKEERYTFLIKIKNYFKSRKVSLLPEFTEADLVAFFIFPILIKIELGLLLGSYILFLNILIEAIYFFTVKYKNLPEKE